MTRLILGSPPVLPLSVACFVLAAATVLLGGRAAAGDPAAATVLAYVRISPLEGTLGAPSSVAAGERFDVVLTLYNRGDGRLRDLDIALHLAEQPCVKVMGSTRQHRGLLRAHDSLTLWWRLQALGGDARCDSLVVVAAADATLEAEGARLRFESEARVLSVRDGGGKKN